MIVSVPHKALSGAAGIIALLATALNSQVAMAQPTAPTETAELCASAPATDALDNATLSKLMVEPHRYASLADIFKALPPEALARIAAMQKTANERQVTDWPYLCRYAADNVQVLASGIRPQVIFLGDSITENWILADPTLFSAKVLDRGIGGQTTAQILLRFYQDVVGLRPRIVHIMAGVNDIMGNTGPTADMTIVNNIRAMIDIAQANGIRVVLAGITPSCEFIAKPGLNLAPRIAAVNRQLVNLAKQKRITFIDYAPALAGEDGGLKDSLGNDGLHPNRDGYAAMRPLTLRAIARAGGR